MKRMTKFLYCLIGLILLAYAFATYYLLFWGGVPEWLPLPLAVYLLLAGCGVSIAAGFWLFARGLLARRRLPALYLVQDGGAVRISPKALRNITFTAVERFEGVLEDRVRVRVLRGQPPRLSVKVWIGVAEYSTLPARHADIRSAIARALCACTGLETVRIDLIFYTAHTETAHNTADPLPEGGQA